MHELGMCEDIVEAVERRAAGRKVSGCTIRVGTLHQVVEPAMDQSFALAAAGTVAEGAELTLVVIPVQASCRTCGSIATSDEVAACCQACGSTDVDVSGGDELILESIVLDAATDSEGRVDVSRYTG